jgi:hypothetical protein
VVKSAQQYLCGLMQAEKRNMERMAEAVPASDEQVLQNFLTHSSWDHRAVMDRVASKADAFIGAQIGTGLYLDESAFFKRKVSTRWVWPGSGTGAWENKTTVRLECLGRWDMEIESASLMRDCTCRRNGLTICVAATARMSRERSRHKGGRAASRRAA